MKTRIIVVSESNGQCEEVTFTEDLDTPALDYCCPRQSVDIDETIDMELPLGFPTYHTLRKM